MSSNSDFITSFLNVKSDDIEEYDIKHINDNVFVDIKLKRKKCSCELCGGKLIGHGTFNKTINHASLREHKCQIRYKANRYICKECGKTTMEDNPFTFEKFKNSYSTIRNAMNYLSNLNYTLEMISNELNISTTQVNKYLDSYVIIPKRPLPESIGIDELHSPELSYKHASYICVLVDNTSRTIYDVLGSRSKNYLSNRFTAINKEEREKVKYVTIDMWEPYKAVAKEAFPNCIVAVDPYHYIKHLCDGFNKLRINLMNQQEYNSNSYYLLKKWHFLLDTDDVDLNNPKKYNRRFGCELNRGDIKEMILETFPTLKTAYYLKEDFREFVKTYSYEQAKAAYDDYLKAFIDEDIKEYYEFTEILKKWKEEIINSFLRPYGDHKLSNALTEHINGTIGTYLSVSRGITNFERFRKRVLFSLNPKINYSLTSHLKSDSLKNKPRGPYNKVKE